jgi:hypothetical protein
MSPMAVQVFGGAKQDRKHRRDHCRALGDQCRAHVLARQPYPLHQDVSKGPVDTCALFILATEHGNALAVLSHALQGEAIFRFPLG